MPNPVKANDDDLARIAFERSPSGMLAVDSRGLIVAVNREAERLFGWSRGELVGQRVETLVPARFQKTHPLQRSGYHDSPTQRPMGVGRELYGLRRDGSEFPVEIGLNPVETSGGAYVLVSVVDITARRKLDEDLRRSQRLETIGILAGGIAHDFNNILLGIVGHTELVLREGDPSPQARVDLDHVLQAAGRGRQLVERILMFSRSADGVRLPLRLERTADEVLSLLRASLPATIEIRSRFDPDTPDVLADETQIHQILMNLATNSAQAMPSGGVLKLELSAERLPREPNSGDSESEREEFARITVRDSGAGMTPEVLEHALEPFFTTKAVGEGTGLGLSVVHGIVRSHRGRMAIESTPGHGTIIRIELPAARDAAAVPVARIEAPLAHAPRRLRVLFVEDEPVLAQMQRRQLEHLGFEVTLHTSSEAALADFTDRPEHFELMITDDTMPAMTGSALALRVLALRADLPILMVSGGDRSHASGGPPAGVRKILRKPHSLRELESAIWEVVEKQAPGTGE